MASSVDIEEYLQSDKARIRMAAAWNAAPREGTRWQVTKAAPWSTVLWFGNRYEPESPWILRGRASLVCYVRPAGEGFIVTDLGTCVRSLRFRTAIDPIRIDELVRGVLGPDPYFIDGPWLCLNNELGQIRSVSVDKLPDAICRVMLASWRVANCQVTASHA